MVLTDATLGVPSCPSLFLPQQNVPPAAMAHEWSPPADTILTLLIPSTSCGVLAEVVDAVPSWPAVFSPQQYAVQFSEIAQVCWPPAEMLCVEPCKPTTSTGLGSVAVDPLPSLPEVPSPQQYATLDNVLAQVWVRPADTLATSIISPVTCAGSAEGP